jgi:hypothetical protein
MAGGGASAEWLAGIDGYDLVLLDLPLGMAPVILQALAGGQCGCQLPCAASPPPLGGR